jgi:hypothetical protein
MHVPLTRDECTFSNDQACASECSLYIVLGHKLTRHGVTRTVPGKRGHANPILDSDVAELERLEKRRIGCHWYRRVIGWYLLKF